MSHFDYISQVAPGFEITSHTDNCPCASSENAEKGLYAIQFHPEVLHTQEGSKMLYNFVRGVCGCFVVIGEWITLLKNKLRLFVKRLEMEKFYVPLVVE